MQEFIFNHQWIIWLAIAWTIPWKGIALWKAARNSDKIWFIILLVFNTLAILEIIYIFIFSRKKEEQIDSVENIPVKNENAGNNGNGNNLIKGL